MVRNIVQAAKGDGITIDHAFDAVGAADSVNQVITSSKTPEGIARLSSAIPASDQTSRSGAVELMLVKVTTKKLDRAECSTGVCSGWLEEKLTKKEFVLNSRTELLSGGLEGVQAGLDKLKQGVIATKLVLEI